MQVGCIISIAIGADGASGATMTISVVAIDSQPLSLTVTSYVPGLSPAKSPVAFVTGVVAGLVPVKVYVIPAH